jgi:hypothetical protein
LQSERNTKAKARRAGLCKYYASPQKDRRRQSH